MSLIVDALKRAQQGAAQHLPPFGGGTTRRSPHPGLGAPGRGAGRPWRLRILVVGMAVVVGGAGWFGRGVLVRRSPAEAPGPPLFVVEPVAPASSAAAPENPPAAADAVAADAGAGPAAPVETAVAPAPRPRAIAPAVRSRPARPRPLTPVAAVVPPSAAPAAAAPETPPVVEVTVLRSREAADALAAGLTHQQRGDLAGAIEQYRRGIAADSRNPGLFNNLGLVLRESGRLDEAARAFDDALSLDSKYEKSLNNLGVTRYQQGRYAEAIDLFRRAIRVNPANVQSHVNLGVIYLPAGRWDEAFGAFQDALRYDPRSAEAHYNLGLLWERRGDRGRALPHYEQFVELADGRHGDLVARVKDYLKQFERRR